MKKYFMVYCGFVQYKRQAINIETSPADHLVHENIFHSHQKIRGRINIGYLVSFLKNSSVILCFIKKAELLGHMNQYSVSQLDSYVNHIS